MPDDDIPSTWDLLTLIDGWNFFGLPALLLAVIVFVLLRGRKSPATDDGYTNEDVRTVIRIGWIHVVLALHNGISLAQELLTLRIMGIPQSFVTPVGAVLGSIMNPILAVGFLRRWGWARRVAIAWYVLRSFWAILSVVWTFYYRAPIDLVWWPELVTSKILPVFLLFVMFLPRIKRVFRRGNAQAATPSAATTAAEPAGGRWLALAALVFLIVAGSNFLVDAADWATRLIGDTEPLP